MSLTPGSLLWRGMLTTAVGIATLAWPGSVIDALVILFSVYAFAAEPMVCLTAYASDRVGPVIGGLMPSFLSFAVGTTALLWPNVAAYTLTIWFGARAPVPWQPSFAPFAVPGRHLAALRGRPRTKECEGVPAPCHMPPWNASLAGKR